MVDFAYLYKGLCGLANAHKAGTLAGHLGAAVVAGYFLGEDESDLPPEVFRGVEREAELGPVVKADHDPREPAYWQGMLKRDEARLTHRIKTLYGYYTVRRHLDDDVRKERADRAFLYLMA